MQGAPDGSAFIPELYDPQWKPLSQEQGGVIDIGHQFEWAYQLGTGAERGLPPLYAEVADRLLMFAVAKGYDRVDSGVFTSARTNGEIDRKKGYWQQAEALRAFMYYAVVRQRQEFAPFITQMTEFIRSEMLDEANGGWYTAPRSFCAKSNCPDIQPDAYHMTTLHMEAIRLAEKYRR
jgi:mannose/cellobiose epimerase-like protein (N-acyl-D-glucosamine 2-epimerase family)